MDTTDNTQTAAESLRPRTRRFSTSQMLVFLLLGAAALMVFNGLLGDMRRKQNALAQAKLHAQTYVKRAGESNRLPLNLEPGISDLQPAKMFRMEWLSSNEARLLRTSNQPVMVAQTVVLPFFLSADGRAVIFYNDGQFYEKWMTLTEFNQQLTRQQVELDRIAATQHDNINQP